MENVYQQCRQCQNWFSKFRSDDVDIKNASRFGKSVEIHEYKIKKLEANRYRLNLSNSIVHDHTKQLDHQTIKKKRNIYNSSNSV